MKLGQEIRSEAEIDSRGAGSARGGSRGGVGEG